MLIEVFTDFDVILILLFFTSFKWLESQSCLLKNDITIVTPGPPLELVLDHIIERKRMDDLSKSIIDRRFSEQKVGTVWF